MVTLGQIMSDRNKEMVIFICSTKKVSYLTSGLCYKRTTDVIYQLCAQTNVRDYERQIFR